MQSNISAGRTNQIIQLVSLQVVTDLHLVINTTSDSGNIFPCQNGSMNIPSEVRHLSPTQVNLLSAQHHLILTPQTPSPDYTTPT